MLTGLIKFNANTNILRGAMCENYLVLKDKDNNTIPWDGDVLSVVSYEIDEETLAAATGVNIENLTLPSGFFAAVPNLYSITIPSEFKELLGMCFVACTSLTEVTLSRLAIHGGDPFPETSLEKIYIHPKEDVQYAKDVMFVDLQQYIDIIEGAPTKTHASWVMDNENRVYPITHIDVVFTDDVDSETKKNKNLRDKLDSKVDKVAGSRLITEEEGVKINNAATQQYVQEEIAKIPSGGGSNAGFDAQWLAMGVAYESEFNSETFMDDFIKKQYSSIDGADYILYGDRYSLAEAAEIMETRAMTTAWASVGINIDDPEVKAPYIQLSVPPNSKTIAPTPMLAFAENLNSIHVSGNTHFNHSVNKASYCVSDTTEVAWGVISTNSTDTDIRIESIHGGTLALRHIFIKHIPGNLFMNTPNLNPYAMKEMLIWRDNISEEVTWSLPQQVFDEIIGNDEIYMLTEARTNPYGMPVMRVRIVAIQ